MVDRVLMVAFHFPPHQGSSGIQRTLSFSRYLPRNGWEPIILTASPRAYPAVTASDAAGLLDGTTIHRSFALDAARHLAICGRYPGWLARPDRWISWCLSAIPAGLWLIRKHRPKVLWSTYPIASAHLIALVLHRISGIPWVADHRDPMTDIDYPSDRHVRAMHAWLEQRAARHAAALVCTSPGALRQGAANLEAQATLQTALIENGYDEDEFRRATESLRQPSNGAFRLVHSGGIYPSERDPRQLFAALARLRQMGTVCPRSFRLVLRASGHDDYLRAQIAQYGVTDLVELAPALHYREALTEMLSADGLLLLQASNCNSQIPAKLYEYLRSRRPILALTDPAGDTAATLRIAGIDTIGRLDSCDDICDTMTRFLALSREGRAPLARPAYVSRQSRAARATQLAELLDSVVERHGGIAR